MSYQTNFADLEYNRKKRLTRSEVRDDYNQ